MKATQQYKTPEIELIHLDSEISLQLQSADQPEGEPTGGEWSASSHQNYFTNDPQQTFKV